MTITRFVAKNAFRNRRRSVLTVLSVAFSLLLLTLMMSIWRAFFLDQGSAQSAQRLITRHKVSLVFFLPAYYREKIRALPGVKQVVNQTWFGGQYKDDKPESWCYRRRMVAWPTDSNLPAAIHNGACATCPD